LQGYDIDLSKSNVNLDYENTDIKNILSNNQVAFSLQDMSQSDNNKYLHIIGIGILTVGKSIKNIVTKGGKNAKNATENKVPENPLNKANDAQKVDKVTKVADNKDIDFDKMATSDKKAVRTLKKRIEEHKIKLEEFKKNPTIREGMENLPEETIKKQQERRMLHLEREIKAFEKNIDDIVKKY